MTLSAESLCVMRGDTLAVDGVTVALRKAEITAICGPNGAGKSTLLGALAGLVSATSGDVRLGEDRLRDLDARSRARAIGVLPQSGEVAWDVAVRNLVALGRFPHRDRGEEQVARALSACDLDQFATRRISTLSGGEKARALLARVLAGEPQWILADEPLAALDLSHQLAMLRVLRAEAERGRGVVLVLHDLALAMNHADRVIVLRDGRLVADGVPQQALTAETIAKGWGVEAKWIGERGRRALVIDG